MLEGSLAVDVHWRSQLDGTCQTCRVLLLYDQSRHLDIREHMYALTQLYQVENLERAYMHIKAIERLSFYCATWADALQFNNVNRINATK